MSLARASPCLLFAAALSCAPTADAVDVRIVQRSIPPGALSSDQTCESTTQLCGPARNVPLQFLTAPSQFNGNRFTQWTIETFNGSTCTGIVPSSPPPLRDAVGRSINPLSFAVLENVCLTATYTEGNADAEPDLVPDYFERLYYGDLAQTALSDNDTPTADGIVLADEELVQLHPRLRDEFVAGGLSTDTSALLTFITDADYSFYRERSTPASIVADLQQPRLRGTTTTTSQAAISSGIRRFSAWRLNGVESRDGAGVAQNPVQFLFAGDTTADALYLDDAFDADSDGLPDWFETRWLGGLAQTGSSDADADGIVNSNELAAGLNPVYRDEFIAGGVSGDTTRLTTIALEALYQVVIRSLPAGLIQTQALLLPTGSPVTTVTAPALVTDQRFGVWEVNGARGVDALGTPLREIATTVGSADLDIVARYFPAQLDSDGDGLPDWFELRTLGNAATTPASDGDGDGFGAEAELVAGLSPHLRDEFLAGGISTASPRSVVIDLRAFPRVREALVSGLPEFFFTNGPPELEGAGFLPGTFAIGADAAPALGDVDGDRDLDLLVAGAGGALRAYRNGGSPVVASFDRLASFEATLAASTSGIARPVVALGDVTGDGRADLAVGGSTGNVRIRGLAAFTGFGTLDQTLATGHASALPAFADVAASGGALGGGDGFADLVVMLPDGSARVYAHSGSAASPYSAASPSTLLPDPVPAATALAAGDVNEDGLVDVVVSDAGGNLWEFHRRGDGGFVLASKIFGGTFAGFATNLRASLGDVDGDGDSDVIAGIAQGNLVYLRNSTEKLSIDPPARTRFSGAPQSFRIRAGAQGSVRYALVEGPSGGTIDAVTGAYVAGPTDGVVDVIEARDDRGVDGVVIGRSYVNVIDTGDATLNGKAIIVAGGLGVNDPIWPATNAMANKAYTTLLFRGYRKENIYYLSINPNQDVDDNGRLDDIGWFDASGVALRGGTATFQNAQAAFTQFALGTDKLFVALIDHGTVVGQTAQMILNGSGERIQATQLKTWLDTLQTTGSLPDANLLLEFCRSGAMLGGLPFAGSAERVVSASTSATEDAKFLLTGQIAYADTYLSSVFQGFDLRTASTLAAQTMAAYQTGQLDDSGNGVGNEAGDGPQAALTRIGPSYVVGLDIPVLERISPAQTLPSGVQDALVFVDGVTSVYPIERAWCSVVPPGGGAADGVPDLDVPEVDLEFDPATRRYQATIGGFVPVAQAGPYGLQCQVRDIWGSVSFPSRTTVTPDGTYVQKLLLVVGGESNSPRQPDANALGNAIYRAALGRGLAKDRIRYLNADTTQDADGNGNATDDVFAPASSGAIATALAGFATDADALAVYLVSGSSAPFEAAPGDALTPGELDALLDAFQANDARVDVVLELGDAASYIVPLAPPGCPAACPTDPAQHTVRYVVATTASNTLLANTGVLSASQMLMSHFQSGRNFREAISRAQGALDFMTGAAQKFQVDVTDAALLPLAGYTPGQPNEARDQAAGRTRYFGPGFAAGSSLPQIARRLPPTSAQAGQPVLVWADGVRSPEDLQRVWAVVQPPTQDPQALRVEVDLAFNTLTKRWEGTFTPTESGEHRVLVYARDLLGNVVPAARTKGVAEQPTRTSIPYDTALAVGGAHPFVEFATPPFTVLEGAADQTITLTLSTPQPNAVSVPLDLYGTAANQDDYRVAQGGIDSPASVVFAPGATVATLDVDTLVDSIAEPTEQLVLSLGAPRDPAILLGPANTTTVGLLNDVTTQATLFEDGFEQ